MRSRTLQTFIKIDPNSLRTSKIDHVTFLLNECCCCWSQERLTVCRIRRWRLEGKINAVALRGQVRVPKGPLDAWTCGTLESKKRPEGVVSPNQFVRRCGAAIRALRGFGRPRPMCFDRTRPEFRSWNRRMPFLDGRRKRVFGRKANNRDDRREFPTSSNKLDTSDSPNETTSATGEFPWLPRNRKRSRWTFWRAWLYLSLSDDIFVQRRIKLEDSMKSQRNFQRKQATFYQNNSTQMHEALIKTPRGMSYIRLQRSRRHDLKTFGRPGESLDARSLVGMIASEVQLLAYEDCSETPAALFSNCEQDLYAKLASQLQDNAAFTVEVSQSTEHPNCVDIYVQLRKPTKKTSNPSSRRKPLFALSRFVRWLI